MAWEEVNIIEMFQFKEVSDKESNADFNYDSL